MRVTDCLCDLQTVPLNDCTAKFEIWEPDVRNRSMALHYYRGAGAAVVVYDITDAVISRPEL